MTGVHVGTQPPPEPGTIGKEAHANGAEADLSAQTARGFWKETGEKPTSRGSLVRTQKALTVGEKQENQTSSKVKPPALLYSSKIPLGKQKSKPRGK